MTKYRIKLTDEELRQIQDMLRKGVHKANYLRHAWILLKYHEGKNEPQIVEEVHVSRHLIYLVKKRYITEGLAACFQDKPRSGHPKTVTTEIEAKITAIACEDPPAGRKVWTIELIQSVLMNRFKIRLAWSTVKNILKKHKLKPWKKKNGVLNK